MKWKSSNRVLKRNEVKCSVGKGENRHFMGKVYMGSKVVRSERLG